MSTQYTKDRVKNCPSCYGSMYIYSELQDTQREYTILSVGNYKQPAHRFVLINRNNAFIACGDSLEEAEQFAVQFGLKEQGNTTMINEIAQNPQAFVNRFAIPLYIRIDLPHVDQLIYELGAVNPLLSKNGGGVLYLTAEKFTNLSFLIEKAKSLGNVEKHEIDDVESEVYDIDHWFFDTVYFEYPKKLKQAKRTINNLPYYLGDCLIVNNTSYTSKQGNEFLIHRIEVNMVDPDETRFVDLITDSNHNFLAIGSNVNSADRIFQNSRTICESLSISMWMRDSF